MNNIKRIEIGKNVNLTLIPDEKFKTNLVSIYIQRNLDRNEVTKNTLIPRVLKNGCNKYKTLSELADIQEELYGSYIGSGSAKRGELQVIRFSILGVNERYLDEKIFKKNLELLNEVVNNPLVEDGGFNQRYLDIEKEMLKDSILSIINDKAAYSMKKANEIMFEGEKSAISSNGYIEDLEDIDRVDLYNHYREILKTSPIEIIVEGGFDSENVVDMIKDTFVFERGDIIDIPKCEYYKNIQEVKEVHEKMDITQGKLVMGYRCNVDYLDEKRYYSMIIGSKILGGGPDSKLFINVREKESLCYTIYSTVKKTKAAMFICSGIEAENYEKTVKLIKEQLENLMAGDITDTEISNAKIAFLNSLNSLNDDIGRITDFYFSQTIDKNKADIDEIKDIIRNVTKEDIVEAVKDIELDTIYFLSK